METFQNLDFSLLNLKSISRSLKMNNSVPEMKKKDTCLQALADSQMKF